MESSRELAMKNFTKPRMTDEQMAEFKKNLTELIIKSLNGSSPEETPKYPKTYLSMLIFDLVVALIVLAVSLSLKQRDFLKVYVLFLLVPILFTSGVGILGHFCATESDSTSNDFFQVILYALRDYIFWSTIFTSVVAFFYSHKAITKPVKTSNTDYVPFFLKAQIGPLILMIFDTVTTWCDVPSLIETPGTFLRSLVCCLVGIVLLAQAVMSVIVFFFKRDEFTTCSPQDQIKHSKLRIFWFMIFQGFMQALNVPFMIMSLFTVLGHFFDLFEFLAPSESTVDNAMKMMNSCGDLHVGLLPLRPYYFLLATILLLVPYRQKLLQTCCPCCCRAK